MKAFLYNTKGEKKEAKAPAFFDTTVREDLVAKAVEVARFEEAQPYGLYSEAGRRHSASGTISHKRHEWKGHYGKGVARVPRKTMWRRGTQFMWIGTEVSGTRGGRRVHGPRIIKAIRKINDKEQKLALRSAIAATSQDKFISMRYPTQKVTSGVHIISELPKKTAEIVELSQKVFSTEKASPGKRVGRAGIGKSRGRSTKVNAGALIVIASTEKTNNVRHMDVVNTKDLSVLDLYPLGRMAIFTEAALEELKNVI